MNRCQIELIERLYPFTPVEHVANLLGTSVSYLQNAASLHQVKKLSNGKIFALNGIVCKVCANCGVCKSLDDYHKNTSNKNGYEFHCKECRYPGSTEKARNRADRKFYLSYLK